MGSYNIGFEIKYVKLKSRAKSSYFKTQFKPFQRTKLLFQTKILVLSILVFLFRYILQRICDPSLENFFPSVFSNLILSNAIQFLAIRILQIREKCLKNIVQLRYKWLILNKNSFIVDQQSVIFSFAAQDLTKWALRQILEQHTVSYNALNQASKSYIICKIAEQKRTYRKMQKRKLPNKKKPESSTIILETYIQYLQNQQNFTKADISHIQKNLLNNPKGNQNELSMQYLNPTPEKKEEIMILLDLIKLREERINSKQKDKLKQKNLLQNLENYSDSFSEIQIYQRPERAGKILAFGAKFISSLNQC